MNLANFPNKAASWLNGKALGDLTVIQVFRDNNRASPNYIAVVRNNTNNTVRACSYAAIGKAFSRQDRLGAQHAFGQGKLLATSAAAVPASTHATTALPKAAFSGLNAASLNAAAGVGINDEDAAMAMMTALVRSARTNPRVANIVKTLATLVN